MASQRFCLRWNNHQSNLLSVFDQLLHAETFTDVTLAVDGQYLKAHKVSVVSSYSKPNCCSHLHTYKLINEFSHFVFPPAPTDGSLCL